MRILVETHTMEVGGSQLNAIELAEAVSRLGHETVVFGPDGALVDEVDRRGLEFVLAPVRRGVPCLATAVALTALTQRRRFDILHPYEWNTLLDTMYGPGWLLGTPVVSTVMSMDVPFFLPPSVPMIVGTRELVVAESRRRPDVRLMEPPIDTELNAPGVAPVLQLPSGARTTVRKHFGLEADERLVVVVGRLSSRLKLEGLLAAVAAMPLVNQQVKAKLIIVGDGPERPRIEEAVRRATADAGRATTVLAGEFLDPRAFYDAADLAFGMGGSILRAMAFGKSVIVQGEQGFWEPLTPETLSMFLERGWYGRGTGSTDMRRLASLIVRSLATKDGEPGRLGRRTVSENYSLSSAAAWLERAYTDVTARHTPAWGRVRDASANARELLKFRLNQRLAGRRWAGV